MRYLSVCFLLAVLSCKAPPLTVQAEPAGVNCAQGGVQVSNGENTVFVCNGETGPKGDRGDAGAQGPQGEPGQGVTPLGPVLEGGFQVVNQADISQLQEVTTITGQLGIVTTGLSSVSLNNLVTVQDNLFLDGNTITPGAATLSLTSLTSVGRTLFISNNPSLTSIDFASLTSVDGLTITNNPNLPTCQAQNLLAQLASPPPNIDISGNDDAGVCP